jgi:hypothetical protein
MKAPETNLPEHAADSWQKRSECSHVTGLHSKALLGVLDSFLVLTMIPFRCLLSPFSPLVSHPTPHRHRGGEMLCLTAAKHRIIGQRQPRQ